MSMLFLGILTFFKPKYPLSALKNPSFGPMSPASTPSKVKRVFGFLIGTTKVYIPKSWSPTLVRA